MYYWNSTTLAKELISNNLTEWEKAKYYLASLFFQMLSSVALAYLVGFSTDEIGAFSYFVAAIIIYFSVVKIFKFVSELQSTSFIEALIVLGFPALIKVTIGFWIVYFALLIAYGTFGVSYFLLQVFHALFAPVYYWAFFNIIYKGLVRANV